MSKKKCDCTSCGCQKKQLCGREAYVGGMLRQCDSPAGHEGPCRYEGVRLQPYYPYYPYQYYPVWIATSTITVGGSLNGDGTTATTTWNNDGSPWTEPATSGYVKVIHGSNQIGGTQ